MNEELDATIEIILEHDSRYKSDAYAFVMESLSFTQRKLKKPTHITGEELLQGIKDLLLERFGPMTLTVLNHWGIKRTDDFGQIVFNLVSSHVLSKTEDDDIAQFRNAYDFNEVFNRNYRLELAKKIARMR